MKFYLIIGLLLISTLSFAKAKGVASYNGHVYCQVKGVGLVAITTPTVPTTDVDYYESKCNKLNSRTSAPTAPGSIPKK